jgi:hypothetical protein
VPQNIKIIDLKRQCHEIFKLQNSNVVSSSPRYSALTVSSSSGETQSLVYSRQLEQMGTNDVFHNASDYMDENANVSRFGNYCEIVNMYVQYIGEQYSPSMN